LIHRALNDSVGRSALRTGPLILRANERERQVNGLLPANSLAGKVRPPEYGLNSRALAVTA